MDLCILYRGSLASCNYGCSYCPFAKRRHSDQEMREDGEALARFVDWTARQAGLHTLKIQFTPWGEALIHRAYQQALVTLSHMPHIRRAVIQTNLSCSLGWAAVADPERLALWCTYHPEQVEREAFLRRCAELRRLGIRHSVGMVGVKENLAEIEAIRRHLPPETYVWANAYKHGTDYYSPEQLGRISAVDPLFHYSLTRHVSLGKPCLAGQTVFSVDGNGEMRRCHFIPDRIGNIYHENWASALLPRTCSNAKCTCHIGYVHMPHLGLRDLFGEGVLERIPASAGA